MFGLAVFIALIVGAACVPRPLAGRAVCRVQHGGKLTAFNGARDVINLPCKYRAVEMTCDGYTIHVTPGQRSDDRGRYFVDTVWVAVYKRQSRSYWKGRTSNQLFHQRISGRGQCVEAFQMKRINMQEGKNFTILQGYDRAKNITTLRVQGARFQIAFGGFDCRSGGVPGQHVGLEVSCPLDGVAYKAGFPDVICASAWQHRTTRQLSRSHSLDTRSEAVIWAMLDRSDVVQTNPLCREASAAFAKCPLEARDEAVRTCSDLVNNRQNFRCLARNLRDPMELFVYCLHYHCGVETCDSNDACNTLKEAVTSCGLIQDPGLTSIICGQQ